MAGDIGWKTVELQIETLVPGVILVFEGWVLTYSWFGSKFINQPWMPSDSFVQVVMFIAISYSIGVIVSNFSRSIVDKWSENGPRAVVFELFAHEKLENLLEECKSDPKFKDCSNRKEMKPRAIKVANWNEVYRSAIRRTTRGAEVDRRRSQGRIVRNLFFPAVLAPFILLKLFLANIECTLQIVFWSIFTFWIAVGIAFVMVYLYAYAEYFNFAEAYDIAETKVHKRRLPRKVVRRHSTP